MTITLPRLERLRAELAERNLDGFIVPLSDEHMSEYVGGYARRLEWLTGFKGSAGTAVILQDRAAIFVDGRYTVQVRQQVPGELFEYRQVPQETVAAWLKANVKRGETIGYDPWLHARGFVAGVEQTLKEQEAESQAVTGNPVDAIWDDQPEPSKAPVLVHPEKFSGESSASKRQRLADAIKEAGADYALLSALDSIAWAFNIRGTDVARTPVARSFALIGADSAATLFIDLAKLTPEVEAHLGADVTLQPYTDFGEALGQLGGKKVLVDPTFGVVAIFSLLHAAGAEIIEARDPAILMKAAKNKVELDGMRAAHRRDGLAMVKFLHSLEVDRPQDEAEAEVRLEKIRRQSDLLKDLSFDTISAFGANGALPHYKNTPETNLKLTDNNLYLVDSGGQYPDGTTDITRTVAIGTPTAAMRRHNTLVLKGHIALARARFPKGTKGAQLDVLARQYLWDAGCDYQHGTGHGVGAYLSVHEGPQRIGLPLASGADEPLVPGMVLSNEPGFYLEGAYGIRIENLVVVQEDKGDGDLEEMLSFETITLAPIDRRLIEIEMLTAEEAEWLDHYHDRVRAAHAGHLDGDIREWLEEVTAPLRRDRHH